jgi:uncharacterized protein (DUF697 family)
VGAVDKGLSIASLIVGVALVTTIVAHPNSASIIKAVGSTFTGAITAAMGTASSKSGS